MIDILLGVLTLAAAGAIIWVVLDDIAEGQIGG
jgi:hypothetical protein